MVNQQQRKIPFTELRFEQFFHKKKIDVLLFHNDSARTVMFYTTNIFIFFLQVYSYLRKLILS